MVKKKPYETYFGGKGATGVYQNIINEIPPHIVYAELFLGNGTIFEKKRIAPFTILADRSTTVFESWVNLGVASVDASHFGFWPGVSIYNLDSIKLLEIKKEVLDGTSVFIYLDPPYPFSVRKNQSPTYEHELSIAEHNALLGVIRSYQNAKIMISSYPNEMYDNALVAWRRKDFSGQTRRGKVTKCIYMNYPEPTELHDYSFIGKNFRDRWRIEKKTRNIVSKFKNLPPLECNAILEAVISEIKSKSKAIPQNNSGN